MFEYFKFYHWDYAKFHPNAPYLMDLQHPTYSPGVKFLATIRFRDNFLIFYNEVDGL
jgi:hypothetical protein